jgi:hypothetical protein
VQLIKQIRTDRRNAQSCYLRKFAKNVTSQKGEDGILARIFEIITPQNKWCVEFGAWDGKRFSNTYNLITNEGWSGVMIEGSTAKFGELLKTYGENPNVVCVNGMVHPAAGADSLEDHLSRTRIPKEFDLLSIDIDGNDYHVWESVSAYRPRVVVIEYNPTIPNDIVFVQERDLMINQGCSLRALVELGKERGYELACATGFNGIFVAKDDFAKLNIADNDIDAMAFPTHDAKYFQGFDGTLFHIGLPELRWKRGVPIAHETLQVLPPEERYFGASPLRRSSAG